MQKNVNYLALKNCLLVKKSVKIFVILFAHGKFNDFSSSLAIYQPAKMSSKRQTEKWALFLIKVPDEEKEKN